ncbi:hypothetical protein RN001_010045 [Aquatica leii]|uniref:Isopenicillin N synthase-like Fe(2+) 2OG dioxygenase domain-containing protein n=1 Tax=Aquatica leii TaxID=1421715 RepID=A0AAN7P5W0_9COLE|nr:hypothetical protein RN001_010045 [Aquatica leii]
MDKPRPCGCKGCRTCLICEKEFGITNKTLNINRDKNSYIYCPDCNLAWSGWDVNRDQIHPNHTGTSLSYPGVYIQRNFLTVKEEEYLIHNIDSVQWDLSQSGRRKQNYGPKCNFKKKKLQIGNFQGFPKFSQFVQERFQQVPILKDFHTIEQCSLEYDLNRGASIDPHIDDCWIWGERIVTVNILGDSVLTMTYNKKLLKYNLDCVLQYSKVLTSDGEMNTSNKPYILEQDLETNWSVRIPMPKRSLLVLYGSARYDWEHQVLREDITERRVCLAYREFTPPYLVNNEGKAVLERACNFF